ncbi:MAG: hypothetical protein JO152_04060 [Mycobacteriaceae bacterium]|nr:hypothetical protein [Mycobacteriaceae bacterium]
MKTFVRAISLTATLAIAGCGGGGGSSATPSAVRDGTALQSVTVTVAVPKRPSGALKLPNYVSPSTQSMTVAVTQTNAPNITPATVPCTSTCTATVSVAPGPATFTVTLYKGPQGTGAALSTGTLATTIVRNALNTVNLTFDPVVANFGITFGNPNSGPGGAPVPLLVIGQPATLANVFRVVDAGANQLVGPGSFVDPKGNPLTFTFTNTASAHAHVSASQLSAPGPVAVAYDGHGVNDTISVSDGLNVAQGSYFSSLPQEQPVNASHSVWPVVMTIGGDGNVWFTDGNGAVVHRHNADGTFSAFPISGTSNGSINSNTLVTGGDGTVWISYDRSIARLSTAGVVTAFPLPRPTFPYGVSAMTRDADGGIAFLSGDGQVGHAALDGTITRLGSVGSSSFGLGNFMLGPDKRLWLADTSNFNAPTLVAFGNGVATRYPVPAQPNNLLAGPDGNLWAPFSSGGRFVKYDTSGNVVSNVAMPAFPAGVFTAATSANAIVDAKGTIYFSDGSAVIGTGSTGAIGRIDTAGNIAEYPIYPLSLYAGAIILSPDGRLYWGDEPSFGGFGTVGGGLGSVDATLL